MKIFLSWSGPRSRAVAETLNDWLRRVIQAVRPFYSPEIEKGAKWSSEVDDALEGTRFGIVCLTPDNLTSPWIHYEAGALAKTKDAIIWTFLHGLTPGDVPPPLGKFQHTVAEKGDVLLLLKTINGRLAEMGGEPLPDRLLEENFELFWPMLEKGLKEAESKFAADPAQKREGTKVNIRGEGAKLDELLELVRSQERRMMDFEERLAAVQPRQLIPKKKLEKMRGGLAIPIPVREGQDSLEAADELKDFIQSVYKDASIGIVNGPTGLMVRVTFYAPVSEGDTGSLMRDVRKRFGGDFNTWSEFDT